MSRPRKPTATLELSGAFDKNPSRRRTDPTSAGAVGGPPKHLDPDERKIWKELRRKAPLNVLTAADGFLLEIICRLMARERFPLMKVPDTDRVRYALSASERNALIQALARLGFTPADRSKISIGKGQEPDSNPFSKFGRIAKPA